MSFMRFSLAKNVFEVQMYDQPKQDKEMIKINQNQNSYSLFSIKIKSVIYVRVRTCTYQFVP